MDATNNRFYREASKQTSAEDAIAHFLLWFSSARYETPNEAAQALMRRLALEGYRIVPAEDE